MDVFRDRWFYQATITQPEKQAKNRTSGFWSLKISTSTYAKCVFHQAWTFHYERSSCYGLSIPMRKFSTGKPCAGKTARTVWREGRLVAFSTPIKNVNVQVILFSFLSCSLSGVEADNWLWLRSADGLLGNPIVNSTELSLCHPKRNLIACLRNNHIDTILP